MRINKKQTEVQQSLITEEQIAQEQLAEAIVETTEVIDAEAIEAKVEEKKAEEKKPATTKTKAKVMTKEEVVAKVKAEKAKEQDLEAELDEAVKAAEKAVETTKKTTKKLTKASKSLKAKKADVKEAPKKAEPMFPDEIEIEGTKLIKADVHSYAEIAQLLADTESDEEHEVVILTSWTKQDIKQFSYSEIYLLKARYKEFPKDMDILSIVYVGINEQRLVCVSNITEAASIITDFDDVEHYTDERYQDRDTVKLTNGLPYEVYLMEISEEDEEEVEDDE